MKNIFTLPILLLLCSTWSFAQNCPIGSTSGNSCTFNSDGNLIIPEGVGLTIFVEAWGPGGGSNGGNNRARAGGSGGAYFSHTYTISGGPVGGGGTILPVDVGVPVVGNFPGESTIFDFGDGEVNVGGGLFGSNNVVAGGVVTGAGASGIGTSFAGGAGGARQTSGAGTERAGGGGGGAGTSAGDGAAGAAGGSVTDNVGGLGGIQGGGGDGAASGSSGLLGPGADGLGVGSGRGAQGNGDGFNGGQQLGGPGQLKVTIMAVLPVELVQFNASAKDDRVLLEWQTANEINNEGFEIQKSKDGISWDMIEFVKGNGNSSVLNTYTSLDRTPNQGSNYYRLKQMDIDGRFEYSNIAVVDFNNRLSNVELFPNPAKNLLTLVNGVGEVVIYNALGQAVKQLTIEDTQATVQLSELSNGQYYLQVLQKDGSMVTKQFSKTP